MVTRAYDPDRLQVGIAQIAPVWLDREKTTTKIVDYINRAADQGCQLVAFGEALLPGYPFWIERTDGARFNSDVQKEIHAHYVHQAVQIEAGHLDAICRAAASQPPRSSGRCEQPAAPGTRRATAGRVRS